MFRINSGLGLGLLILIFSLFPLACSSNDASEQAPDAASFYPKSEVQDSLETVAEESSDEDSSKPWYNRSGLRAIFGDFDEIASQSTPAKKEIQDLYKTGHYLVNSVAACGSCHGNPIGDPRSPLSGGQKMKDRFDFVNAANITPEPKTGIGQWTVMEVVRALRSSIDRQGKPLSLDVHAPYRWISDRDAKAIAVYLFSLEPVENAVERRSLGGFERNKMFLFSQHNETKGYVLDFPQQESYEYGRYLSSQVAGCRLCHGAANAEFGSTSEFAGGGGRSRGMMASLGRIVGGLYNLLTWRPEKEDPSKLPETRALLSLEAQEALLKTDDSDQIGEPNQEKELKSQNDVALFGENKKYDPLLEQGVFPVGGPNIRGDSKQGLADWSQEDIISYLGTGETPKGKIADGRFCPWPYYRNMSNEDKLAIALFLKHL